jgi:hypothetical protein
MERLVRQRVVYALRGLGCRLWLSLATAALVALPTGSVAQVVLNGPGLAVTQLTVREKVGANWVPVGAYQSGRQYRITVRLMNTFPPVNPGGFATAGCHVSFLIKHGIELQIAGAVFQASAPTPTSRADGAGPTIGLEDYEPLYNGQSRAYDLFLTWNGPTVAPSRWPHKLGFRGFQACALPRPPSVPVYPRG